jgi:hypothetical protein
MNICRPAAIVLVISTLGIILDIYLFGFLFFELIKNVIVTTIIVFITNWTLLIVTINLLLLFSSIYLIKNKNAGIGKNFIEEEKQNRNKN